MHFKGFKYRNVKVLFLLKHLHYLFLKMCIIWPAKLSKLSFFFGGTTVLGKLTCSFSHQCSFCVWYFSLCKQSPTCIHAYMIEKLQGLHDHVSLSISYNFAQTRLVGISHLHFLSCSYTFETTCILTFYSVFFPQYFNYKQFWYC